MNISFPYMGCVTGYKKILELLGHNVIMPDKPTQRTIDLGVLYSPEFICFPFKVMLGTYIEACEKGADVIISSGGDGPCRAGLYGELHSKILKQLGYDVEIIIFDSIFRDFKDFLRKIYAVKNNTPLYKVLYYTALSFKLICELDNIEKLIKQKRAYEIHRDDFNKCFAEIIKLYDKCYNFKQLRKTKHKAYEMLNAIPIRQPSEEERIRIGIVGEIYVIMESFVNVNIEQRLNAMGVEVYNVQYISDWVRHNLIPRAINKAESWKMYDKAERYKTYNCGGHDMENTGWIVNFAEKGFDGVIHLLPFGCLPELVTRSIIPQMSKDLDIPILSISIDEQQGEANIQTRLEAFVDLCKNRKKNKAAADELKYHQKKSGSPSASTKEYAVTR